MITKYAEGCYRLKGYTLDAEDLQTLLTAANSTKLKRARVCIHESESDQVQEMFVLLMHDTVKGTYKYLRPSSKYLLHGKMDIEFHDANATRVSLNAQRPFVRVPADTYHTPILLSEYVLLHEIHQGPWTKEFMQCLTSP